METKAPDGYNMKAQAVVIDVTGENDQASVEFGAENSKIAGVMYNDEDSELSLSKKGIRYDAANKVYTLKIVNHPGIELAETGGSGSALFTALGGLITAMAGAILTLKKRKGHA